MARAYGQLTDCVFQSPAAEASPADGLASTSNSKSTYGNVDLNGSKVIRLVRAKQATKRKSSLDTLIEVVQKELLRVNGQSPCPSPPPPPPPPPCPKRILESNETIDEIVRETVDKLVAITLLNNAPFFVNMLTSPPDSSSKGNTSTTKSSSSSHPPATSDLALLSSAASDIRNSMQQASPRLLTLPTVLPKATTNIQIGKTKIILVSPASSSVPVKLVKFTPKLVLPSSSEPIPVASQEVTVTSSPPLSIVKPRRRSSTSTPLDKPVGKILRPIAKVLPPTNKITLPTTPNGPMIYRMTSVNPNVPVFRVRTSAETKPVSVLACFKTTKKRNKERAIMPRPTSEPVEPPPAMKDKGIQCLNEAAATTTTTIKRDLDEDDGWAVAADTLLRNVLSQYCFRFLDMNCQQNLSSRFDTIQANLVSGMIPNHEQFYQSVMEIKTTLLSNGLSKMSADNLEKLFHYFQMEFPKLRQGESFSRTNERKRTRRQ